MTPPAPLPRTALVLALLAALTGCSGTASPDGSSGAQTSVASTTPSATSAVADPSHPVGVIAIGHSAMTGFQSDPDSPGENAPANSWATGTNPTVQSIYQRMVAALPETRDHVANVSRNGEKADGLEFQVPAALKVVPTPRLALVQIMDNDIRCDGTDPAHLPEFRAQVRAAVQQVVAASPKVVVLLVGGQGRPAGYAATIAALPQTPVDLVGTGPCDMFSKNRVVNRTAVAHVTSLIAAYEAEFVAVCKGIPQCHTDNGAAASAGDRREDLGNDLGHQSIAGHARLAEVLWPQVSRLLGVS